MKKISVLLALALLALGALLPALAQADAGRLLGQGRDPIRFDAAEGEGEEESEEAQEEATEGEEESEQEAQAAEEAEEEGGGAAAQGHRGAGARRSSTRLSSLALTHNGLTALRQSHPRTSNVCFSFTLSATAQVQAVLATQAHAAGRTTWHMVSHVTLSGKRGSNLAHLSGRTALAAGYDRLTLIPAHGLRRTIAFRVK